MKVSMTFVLLFFVFLEVGGPLAAMEAGGGFLQVNKSSSSSIKPSYPYALLRLLLPGHWCGMVPSPIKSSRERCMGSSPRCSVRPAAHRLHRRRSQLGRALPRGVGSRPVPGGPVHLGVLPGPPRDTGVHADDVQQGKASRRRLLQGSINVRRPRVSIDNGSLRDSTSPRGRPKAEVPTSATDGAFATPKDILPDIEATSVNELPRAHDNTKRRRREPKSGSCSLCCARPTDLEAASITGGVSQKFPRRWMRGAVLWGPPPALWAMLMSDAPHGAIRRCHVRRRRCFSLLSKDEKGLVAFPAISPSPLCWGQSTSWAPLEPGASHAEECGVPPCSIAVTMQPLVLVSNTTIRRLLLWCWFNDSASIRVFSLSFFYLRRCDQHHPLIIGMFFRQLNRPNLYRRSARSVYSGARVFDAPANTPHRQNRRLLRLSQCCYLLLRSQDLHVTWSSFEDLYVIWLL